MAKVTPAEIEAKIVYTEYVNPKHNPSMTVAFLTLENGYTVVGKSCPIDPKDFDKVMGETIARKDAVDQIWAAVGYELKQKQFDAKKL